MIYSGIRIAIFILMAIALVVLFTRKHLKKSLRITLCLLGILICISISIIPFENAFTSFSSPESVFQYVKSGPIIRIVNGSESALVLYKSGDTSSGSFFTPKSGDGYKISSFYTAQKVKTVVKNSLVLNIYHIRNTSDYYIEIVGSVNSGDTITISDHTGKNYEVIRETLLNNDIIRCVESVQYDGDFQLFINDELFFAKEEHE